MVKSILKAILVQSDSQFQSRIELGQKHIVPALVKIGTYNLLLPRILANNITLYLIFEHVIQTKISQTRCQIIWSQDYFIPFDLTTFPCGERQQMEYKPQPV